MRMEISPVRAAVYVRISADADGEGKGVARQEADARALCERRGWTVAKVYSDNDISAWSGKVRPAYRTMLTDIESGLIDAVVAYHPDRLYRQVRDLLQFAELANKRNVMVETVTAGDLGLATASGRMQTTILGTLAQYESEHKSERIKRKLLENAAEGRHHGGSRPYGWLNDRVTLDPLEAGVVQEAAAQVLNGESLKSIARGLNEAGYVTVTGRSWHDITVRDMLLRERNAGIRVHHGAPVGPGKWEPIFDLATLLSVKAVLLDPSRRTTPGRDGLVHLLTRLAVCGVCQGRIVVAKAKPYKGRSMPIYRCRVGHVSRVVTTADTYVRDVVLAFLARPDSKRLLAAETDTRKVLLAANDVEALRQRLDEAAAAYAAGVLTLGQLEIVTKALRPQIAAAESAMIDPNRARILRPLLGPDPAAAWVAMQPGQRRLAVGLLVDKVTIHRVPPGTRPVNRGITLDFSETVELRPE